jgi:hypothetical protein
MRILPTALLTGVAAVAIGFSGAASAQNAPAHVITVQLPDGGAAQITYTGNIAPRISFSAPAPIDVFAPLSSAAGPSLFGPGSPFAMLDRISAAMDREAAAMFRQAEAISTAARSGRLTETTFGNLPPGSASYSFVSTMSGNGVCSQSVEITRNGNGAPHVVRHSSGNCAGTAGAASLPTVTPPSAPGPVWTSAPFRPYAAPAPASRPDMVWTSAEGAKPYAGLVQKIPAAR